MRRTRSTSRTASTKSISKGGAPAAARLYYWLGLGARSRPSRPVGKPQATASAGQAQSQSRMSSYERCQRVRSRAIKGTDSSLQVRRVLPFRERWGAAPMRGLERQAAECQQVQPRH